MSVLGPITVRQASPADLPELDRIFRLAFGTFLGLPDPSRFAGDAEYVHNRWAADPEGALAAEVNGELAGSNFLTRWGSFGFFGPLTVRPDFWDRGVAKALLAATVDRFAAWRLARAGLYTFPHSAKHVGLYQKFGYWPRYLTMVMARPVVADAPRVAFDRYSGLPDKTRALAEARELTGAIYRGLDVTREIEAVFARTLGDTLFIRRGARLAALAVCHAGAGTEAGSGTCYVKFGAASEAPDFSDLLSACDAFALAAGATRIRAGVNTARTTAYRMMLEQGFRAANQGIAMESGDGNGYNRPDTFVLDDWQ